MVIEECRALPEGPRRLGVSGECVPAPPSRCELAASSEGLYRELVSGV